MHPTNPDPSKGPGFPLTPATLKAYLMTPIELKQWQADLRLSDVAMSAYLGVPMSTYTKWNNGTRTPDAAPVRLFALLRLIQAAYPVLHAQLIHDAQSLPELPRRPRGRPAKGLVQASPENAPRAPKTAVPEIPGWLTGAV